MPNITLISITGHQTTLSTKISGRNIYQEHTQQPHTNLQISSCLMDTLNSKYNKSLTVTVRA